MPGSTSSLSLLMSLDPPLAFLYLFCRLDTYYKFIFVRDPFTRLLSAWKDKFLREDISGTRRRFGPKIIKKYRCLKAPHCFIVDQKYKGALTIKLQVSYLVQEWWVLKMPSLQVAPTLYLSNFLKRKKKIMKTLVHGSTHTRGMLYAGKIFCRVLVTDFHSSHPTIDDCTPYT